MTAAVKSVQRDNDIELRVEELWAQVRQSAPQPRPQKIQLGQSEIPIESWVWEALVAWTTTAAAADLKSWHVLIAEGIALQAKSLDDLDRIAARAELDDELRGLAFAELDYDALTAFKLLREVQRTIEQMIVKGRIDQAKKLTQFRRRLNDTTAAIGRVLGEAALKEIEDLADSSPWVPVAHFDPPPPDAENEAAPNGSGARQQGAVQQSRDEERMRALVALEEQLRQEDRFGCPQQFIEPTAVDLEELGVGAKTSVPARTALIAFLCVVCVGWALLTLRQRAVEVKLLPGLALSDFAGQHEITGVVARAPSLYVTVDAQSWTRMGLLERQQLIEAIGAKLAAAGYVGAHVTDSDGNSVARWLKDTGVKITENSHRAS